MNITQHFFDSAARHPGKAAIIDRNGEVLSFGQLAEEVKTTAAYYRSKGIGRGDRVLVFVPMSIPLYRSVLALFHIGAVAVFLDEWVSRERLEICCRMARCKAFIAPFKLRTLAFLLSPELRRVPVWLGEKVKQTNAASSVEEVSGNETALITFTTGSTGIPKAADRTHAFLQAQFDALIDEISPAADDVDMPVLPIVLLLNLGSGITSVVANYNPRKPKTLDAAKIRAQILSHGVNRLICSPFLAEELARHSAQHPGKDSTQLRRIFTGGAPVYPDQAATMQRGFPQAAINIVYGSTEAEPISRITAPQLAQQGELSKGLAVGTLAKAATVIILPVTTSPIEVSTQDELLALQLPHGQTGEIVVSGPHVLRHYIDNPEAVKQNKIFIGNQVWHRTGDAGYMDAQGQLFLCGRCASLITDAQGHILAPFLWEGKLRMLPGVTAGTILQLGEKIMAIIEPDKNADQEKVKATVQNLYAFHEIRIIAHLPRDPRHFSKVDYGKLKEMMTA
ncbi:MAG: AMP-binding protein [Bacteroidia bacterium]|jgi:acyl-CoA synthetase (AMP-forming)/AMP-acid ligase II|nr:AMP-binding protein [Bacteroidia bacterium]